MLRPPNGVKELPAMLSRLLEAHETMLAHAHDAAAAPPSWATTAPTTC